MIIAMALTTALTTCVYADTVTGKHQYCATSMVLAESAGTIEHTVVSAAVPKTYLYNFTADCSHEVLHLQTQVEASHRFNPVLRLELRKIVNPHIIALRELVAKVCALKDKQ